MNRYKNDKADETRIQVNTGGANVADYCLQNHVAALWAGKVLAMERLRNERQSVWK